MFCFFFFPTEVVAVMEAEAAAFLLQPGKVPSQRVPVTVAKIFLPGSL